MTLVSPKSDAAQRPVSQPGCERLHGDVPHRNHSEHASIMLKVQLYPRTSRIAEGLHEIEDIVTGDFLGDLDYLTRSGLADLLRRLRRYEDDAMSGTN
jgi:hypothetical protein